MNRIGSTFRDTFFILISMLLIVPDLCGQAPALEGEVIDAVTREPLPGVSICVLGTKIGGTTDTTGRFALNQALPLANRIKVRFHLIGYEDKVITFNRENELDRFTISLIPASWKMENIVVTATRRGYILKDVPITTELITANEFLQTGALTVDEALSAHIGVDIEDDLSGKGISLRGIDPSRVLVMVDGNRAIGRVRGSIDLGQIPLGNVEQIEIVKGTGSTLYGSDAIGGVVNIITAYPAQVSNLDIYAAYGSFNSYDLQAGLSSPRLGKASHLTAKFEHTDGFDLDKATPHTNGLENIDRFNVNNKSIFALVKGLDLTASAGFMVERKYWLESETVQIGSERDTTYNFDDFEDNYRYDGAAKLKWQIGSEADLQAGLYGSYYDHAWEKYSQLDVLADTSKTIDDIYSFDFQYNRRFANWSILTFGGDVTSQGLKSGQLASGANRIHYEDLYAQFEFRSVANFALLPGLRWEYHQTYGSHFNPGLNAMWDACSYFNLRGSVSRGFRAPSLKELYFEFDHIAAGYKVIGGGEDLNPETSWNYSITAELNYHRRAMHRFTYFRNDLYDLIEFSDGDFSDPRYWRGVYYYDNIVKARTSGIEWETEIQALRNFDLSFSYTYLLAENLTEGIDLINRPQHTFKFDAGYKIAPLDTRLNFWGLWHDHKLWVSQGDTPERESNDYAPSRWNLNASLTRRLIGNLDLFLRIENLTNETNVKYGYWPGRSYKISLSYNLTGSKQDEKAFDFSAVRSGVIANRLLER